MCRWDLGEEERVDQVTQAVPPCSRFSVVERSRVRPRCRMKARLPDAQSNIWREGKNRLWLGFHVSVDISGKPLRILRRLGNVIAFEFRWFRFTAHPHLKSHKTWPSHTNYQQLMLLDLCILLLWHLTFPRAQAYGVLHMIIHSRIGPENAGCHL